MKTKARVIAFYLPQFHPIPENDEWWGKGFTEWTNVGKAKPLFRGHYQPRVPADLGYYDLRLPIVREQQAEMAREAGVEGFCYWHYWLGNGKMLLAEIFDEVLASGKPDFPFCLGWANHTWESKSWNSSAAFKKNKILVEQKYPGDEDYVAHFYKVLPAFKDKRYITIDGKPLFLIYHPLGIPDFDHFKSIWNDLAMKNGLNNGIYFVLHAQGKKALRNDIFNLKGDGFNIDHFVGAQERVIGPTLTELINKLRRRFPKLIPPVRYRYKDIISNWFTERDQNDNYYPMVFPNFDRSPRAGVFAQIYTKSTPELFKKHLADALTLVNKRQNEHKILFLKSWNEWAEGNYMEPDIVFGHGYLDALRDVIVEK